jgi:sarcosine oxidase subunit beta
VWREAELKPAYDVVIVGGGGHGLATAFYLAKEHGVRNVAVLEKSWLGSGNVGRNTTIIRSNYLLPPNTAFYEWSMKLWEGLEQDLNYNAMVSQRGVLNLYHSDAQRDAYARRGNAMRLHGVDAELLDAKQVRAMLPYLDYDNARFHPGGSPAPRGKCATMLLLCRPLPTSVACRTSCRTGGTASASTAGASSASTTQRLCSWRRLACAGNLARAPLAGLWPPIESHVLARPSSRGAKPLIDTVITFGAGHFYISQSDKGGCVQRRHRPYNSYAWRSTCRHRGRVRERHGLMPMRWLCRWRRGWAGYDGWRLPIIDKTPSTGST